MDAPQRQFAGIFKLEDPESGRRMANVYGRFRLTWTTAGEPFYIEGRAEDTVLADIIETVEDSRSILFGLGNFSGEPLIVEFWDDDAGEWVYGFSSIDLPKDSYESSGAIEAIHATKPQSGRMADEVEAWEAGDDEGDTEDWDDEDEDDDEDPYNLFGGQSDDDN